ncbi:S1 RNA-binding domain-containing protein [Synergistes jonesii]|uniref:General stress protein n=1 Tax=Synergistes jonesii TaxID=2754 RepID=A0A073J4D1_9BACT|nr:S1 RNA-binding domain-containing protein [Synergistes jonesii]KEJ92557.1 general stress protein [Synergistes jonesii]OFB61724.1 general stress protein [Synergistes jonesii]OFB63217.1 general stress protein [Synergistes jonesii]OFB64089.1 general stress protein [Synergistes jonesii]OFB67923.1 general stress protein [Synergistes jonesii]
MAEKAAATVPAVSVGETVSGTVEHVAPYGAFVRLESGQKAMVHISELSQNYVKKVEDVLDIGQKVTAKVIKIDDKGRIDLSIKALQAREVRQPAHREEDFEKKLTNFLKFSVEKMADLNSKNKAQRSGTKRRTGGQQGKK